MKRIKIERVFHLPPIHPASYDAGWIDGWNACRSEQPDKREFMTREKMNERYPQEEKKQ